MSAFVIGVTLFIMSSFLKTGINMPEHTPGVKPTCQFTCITGHAVAVD